MMSRRAGVIAGFAVLGLAVAIAATRWWCLAQRQDDNNQVSEHTLATWFPEIKPGERGERHELMVAAASRACESYSRSVVPSIVANAVAADEYVKASLEDEWNKAPFLIHAVLVNTDANRRQLTVGWCDLSRRVTTMTVHIQLQSEDKRRLDIEMAVSSSDASPGILGGADCPVDIVDTEHLLSRTTSLRNGVPTLRVSDRLPLPPPDSCSIAVTVQNRFERRSNAVDLVMNWNDTE